MDRITSSSILMLHPICPMWTKPSRDKVCRTTTLPDRIQGRTKSAKKCFFHQIPVITR